jgi:hypothetical protein
MPNNNFPKAMKHGDLEEISPNVFFVTGSCSIRRPLPMKFSRNMTVVREGNELTLINTVRLNDAGLEQLDALGQVKHVIRIAGFHGMDDPFYKDRYGAKVWSVDAVYNSSFEPDPKPEDIYLEADVVLSGETILPISSARIVAINSSVPKEALLLLERDGGILISGDCLQSWSETDQYFSFIGKKMMKKAGFIKAHNVGPAWLKFAKPDKTEMKNILNVEFQNLLPAHGKPVVGSAKDRYREVLLNL